MLSPACRPPPFPSAATDSRWRVDAPLTQRNPAGYPRGQVVITEAALATLRAGGQRLLDLRPTAGETPHQLFPSDVDFVVARLAGSGERRGAGVV